MDQFLDGAAALQRGVKADEARNLDSGLDDYSEAQTRQAVVHTRQDIVIIVSLLRDLNRQLRTLKWTVIGIFAALVLLLLARS
ncbi:MAG: hypothetical protein C4345_13910 [Chloroflexota bacterium]